VLRRIGFNILIIITSVWVNVVPAVGNSDLGIEEFISMRDPFTPSQLMYHRRSSEMSNYSQLGRFNPNDAIAEDIPDMRLRGFVSDDSEKMLALLEVVGRGVFMVREGDEININPRRPSEAIRITSITRLGVTVETGTIGKIRVLK